MDIDFSNKPEGATHYVLDSRDGILTWYKKVNGDWFWIASDGFTWDKSYAYDAWFDTYAKEIPASANTPHPYTHRQYIGDLLTLTDECLNKANYHGLVKWRKEATAYSKGATILYSEYSSGKESIIDEPTFIDYVFYRIKPRTIKGDIEIAEDVEVAVGVGIYSHTISMKFKSIDDRNAYYQSITKLLEEK